MSNIRLGLFDSGIGGFTVLKSIVKRHGEIHAIYFGDTARVPYGRKNTEQIRGIAKEVNFWLQQQDISALVVACNTTNSLALDLLHKLSPVPVFDLIDSVSQTITSSRIGVLATPSTVSSSAYKQSIQKYNPDAVVIENGCPSLVPLIETGQLSSDELRLSVKKYLEPLLDQNVESIVLGCSHYPLIKNLFKEFTPGEIKLIDPSESLSKRLDSFLGQKTMSKDSSPTYSNVCFCVSSDQDGFATRTKYWLGVRPQVKLVSLRSEACVL